ncbi:TlpA family protein disulfide reductase [Parafilimonas sp.]|uniref:TlpA family protein disulfide reductase n=1 Tax=Parafilimonas sp. TaxID=1969739 RepID=UPI0039E2A2AD
MKFIVAFFSANLFFNLSHAQNILSSSLSVDSVLNKASRKLHSLKSIKYDDIRELNYASENYHNNSVWTSYYDFQSQDTLIGFKYQIEDSTAKMIFNSTESFDLDKKSKTIQINDHPVRNNFNGLSFFYNSIITLRNVLPLLLKDKIALKTITDTTINGAPYILVTVNIGKRRIQYLGKGFDTMQTKTNFIYKIAFQKNSYLPYEVLQMYDVSPDFIKTTFINIDTTPPVPSELSWYYTTYLNDYKQINKTSLQLAPVGSLAPPWKLESYNSKQMISLSDFKGKVILLDFWIKNCGPCIQSVPHLNKLEAKFKNEKFSVISINSYDTKSDISWFCNKFKTAYTVLLNGKEVADKYGINGYPTFVIIDKTGKIIYTQVGYGPSVQSAIEQVIHNAL